MSTQTALVVMGMYGLRGLSAHATNLEDLASAAAHAQTLAFMTGVIAAAVLAFLTHSNFNSSRWLLATTAFMIVALSLIGLGIGWEAGHLPTGLIITCTTAYLAALVTGKIAKGILTKRHLPATPPKYRITPAEPDPAWYVLNLGAILAEALLLGAATWLLLKGASGFAVMDQGQSETPWILMTTGFGIILAVKKTAEHGAKRDGPLSPTLNSRADGTAILVIAITANIGMSYAITAGITETRSAITALAMMTIASIARHYFRSQQGIYLLNGEQDPPLRLWYESAVAAVVMEITNDTNPDHYDLEAIYDAAFERDPTSSDRIRRRAGWDDDDLERLIYSSRKF